MESVRLGIDPGSKHLGVAISDKLAKTARNLETVPRGSVAEDADLIKALIDEHGIGEVVVGLPLSLDGTKGPEALSVLEYVAELKKRLPVPVKTWDERLTSVSAENILGRRRRHLTHEVAAAIILQNYLDSL